MYVNFMSGGLGGHIHSAEGIWQSVAEEAASIEKVPRPDSDDRTYSCQQKPRAQGFDALLRLK